MKVRAFGIKTATGGELDGMTVGEGDNAIAFTKLGPTLNFVDAAFVVMPAIAVLSGDTSEQRSATEALARQIMHHCRNGGLACVYYDESDVAHPKYLGSRLLQRWNLTAQQETASLEQTKAPEFEDYLTRFAVPGFVFARQAGWPAAWHVLASNKEQAPSAFAVPEGAGLVYFLPANIVAGAEARIVQALTAAVIDHSHRVFRPATAPIASSFEFTLEVAVRSDRKAKQDDLDNLDQRLDAYMEMKDILYLRSQQLEDRLVDWIPENLGIQTSRRPETNIEDFWLLNDKGDESAIVEVKALTQNVKRDQIGAIALHRDQRELKPTFPAVLIANTFAEANTIKQKSRSGVGLNECKHAVRRDVLVVRTLDLLQLLDQLERKVVSQEEVWRLLTKETGWLKVEGDTQKVITG